MSSQLDPAHQRPLTVEDLVHTPDDGRRCELVDGRIDASTVGEFKQACAVSRLLFVLGLQGPDSFEVLPGPGIVFNDERTHFRIPDLIVFPMQPLPDDYLSRPPLLAVEVVSMATALRDLHTKRREYAEFGVASYWIVDPTPHQTSIVELRLENGRYTEAALVQGEDVFETTSPFPVRVVPHWLTAMGGDDWRKRIGGDQPPHRPPVASMYS